MARAVLRAINADYQTLKPVPPPDMHAKMEAALRAMGDVTEPIPDHAFTVVWVAENFNLSVCQAHRRVKALIASGQIRKAGRRGYTNYYVFTDDGQPKPGSKPSR